MTAVDQAVADLKANRSSSAPTPIQMQVDDLIAALQQLAAGAPPSGGAGGDLSGNYPNPVVAKIQGRAVSAGAPGDGNVLTWVAANNDWEPKAPVAAAPVIVQSASASGAAINGVTFAQAPAQGNIVIEIWMSAASPAAAAGWAPIGAVDSSGNLFQGVAAHLVGAAESATQNWTATTTDSVIVGFEISGGLGEIVNTAHNASAATLTVNAQAPGFGVLALGAFEAAAAAALPTGITNATLDSGTAGATRSVQGFHNSQAASANTAYQATWAAAHTVQGTVVFVH